MGASESNARARNRRKKPGFLANADWQGFIDIRLSDGDKDDIAQYAEEFVNRDWMPAIQGWLEEGYKLSLSPDAAHSCVIATLTGSQPGCVNLGFSLSARGPDMVGALTALWFKHVHLCEGLSWEIKGQQRGTQLELWG